MPLSDFRCIHWFRVPFCDVDMMQHVNNASYVVWAETARCEYFDEVMKQEITGPTGIILAHLEFDYYSPLDFREEVAVGCRISRVGKKSFDFVNEIWSERRQVMAARGLTTMVAYDYEKLQSIAIPERWREIVNAYEVVKPG